MAYLSELRTNWRPLLAGFIGLAVGSSLSNFTLSLFAPELIAAFGWTKSQFALVGALPLICLILYPLIGRFTDRFGPSAAAIVGFIGLPATYLAISLISGKIAVYFAIMVAHFLLGAFTSPLVFCRVIVERFDRARGIALSIVMTGAPLAGAVAAPILGRIIETDGWREAYRALAAISAIGGLIAIILLPGQSRAHIAQQSEIGFEALRKFAREPVFWMIIGGIFLINLPQTLATSQLKLLVMDRGASGAEATWLISHYATGVLVGRFICGLALDRFSAHRVALVALGAPAIGFMAIAAPGGMPFALAGAVLLIGLAQGAEGDIGAFLVSKKFTIENYSLILSFVVTSLGAASALGAIVLSLSLELTGGYVTFLLFAAGVTIAGALSFFVTGESSKAA